MIDDMQRYNDNKEHTNSGQAYMLIINDNDDQRNGTNDSNHEPCPIQFYFVLGCTKNTAQIRSTKEIPCGAYHIPSWLGGKTHIHCC